MDSGPTERDPTDTVYGWLRPSYWNRLIPYDPRVLAGQITRAALASGVLEQAQPDNLPPRNHAVLAALVLSEAAHAFPASCNERNAIIAALGYLLANLRAHPAMYLHPIILPFGEADLSALDTAEKCYEALKIDLEMLDPQQTAFVRPMEGSVRIVLRSQDGTYPADHDHGNAPSDPEQWEGPWNKYPLS